MHEKIANLHTKLIKKKQDFCQKALHLTIRCKSQDKNSLESFSDTVQHNPRQTDLQNLI